MRCPHRLSKLLLRHGRVWDRSTWTNAHREWLGSRTFAHHNTEPALIDDLAACDWLTARKQALHERLSGVALDPEAWPLMRSGRETPPPKSAGTREGAMGKPSPGHARS